MAPTITTPLARLLAVAAIPTLTLGLSACGASSPEPAASSSTAPSDTSATADLDDWRLAFAKCVRGEGVDYPDPAEGEFPDIDPNDPAFVSASTTCLEQLGPSPIADNSRNSNPKSQDSMLKTANCLREHGVEVADPADGTTFEIPDASEEALEACGVGRTR